MARPYSMDLRERVVAATERGGMSCREAARHFGVAASTAIKWLQRVRATGSAAPGQIGGHRRRAIAGEHRDWLLERCKARDFTLRGLVAELAERGLKVDYRTMWSFVHGEKLSLKKPHWPASRIVPTLRAGDLVVADNLTSHKQSAVRRASPVCGLQRRARHRLRPSL